MSTASTVTKFISTSDVKCIRACFNMHDINQLTRLCIMRARANHTHDASYIYDLLNSVGGMDARYIQGRSPVM